MPIKEKRQPPEKGSILKNAQQVKADIYAFYDEHAGNVNLMLLTPWGKEEAAASMALKAERAESEGEVFFEQSLSFWKKYEVRYGDLNEMMSRGQIILELVLDCTDLSELENFIQKLQESCNLSLNQAHQDQTEEEFPIIGMTLPVYHRSFVITDK